MITNPSSLSNVHSENVLSVHHYTDHLFSFTITRPQNFRFRSGEFVMLSLPNLERSVFRAYSITSPAWKDTLDFFSIKVPEGFLTSRLQKIKPGDTILLRKKTTGTLVLDALTSGTRLFMISTGTGIAPFASLIRDPETYEKFDQVILAQTCRDCADLTYGKELMDTLPEDPLIGEYVSERVSFYFSTTQETSPHMGRITDLIKSGKFYSDLSLAPFNPKTDRIMCCGSSSMLDDIQNIITSMGFEEGSLNHPNSFVRERAFAG